MNPEKIVANGWSAALPAGWEDRSVITLVGETDRYGFAANIVVTREKVAPQASVESYAREQAELMRAEAGEVQILDERAIKINNLHAYQRLQRFAPDGLPIQQVQTFILADGVIYAITGTATVEAFDRSIPAFKTFVETFAPTGK